MPNFRSRYAFATIGRPFASTSYFQLFFFSHKDIRHLWLGLHPTSSASSSALNRSLMFFLGKFDSYNVSTKGNQPPHAHPVRIGSRSFVHPLDVGCRSFCAPLGVIGISKVVIDDGQIGAVICLRNLHDLFAEYAAGLAYGMMAQVLIAFFL